MAGPGGMTGGLQQPWAQVLVLAQACPASMLHRLPCWSSSTCFPFSSPAQAPRPLPTSSRLWEQEDFVVTEAEQGRGRAEPVGAGGRSSRCPGERWAAPSALAVCLKLHLLFLPPHRLPSYFVPPWGPAGCYTVLPRGAGGRGLLQTCPELPRKAAPRKVPAPSLLSPWLLPGPSRQGAGGNPCAPHTPPILHDALTSPKSGIWSSEHQI